MDDVEKIRILKIICLRCEFRISIFSCGLNTYHCILLHTHKCHINRDNSHNLDERRWIEQRCIISHYKFYLAFENSQHIGYVTEKLWQALVMGSIPIYWGAPDVVKYLPDPDAIINVSHFDTIEELAKYIRSLLVSSHAYEKHMMWRKRPLPASFRNIFNDTVGAAACRLCDHIAMKKQSK